MEELYIQRCRKRADLLIADFQQPSNRLLQLLPSHRQYQHLSGLRNRLFHWPEKCWTIPAHENLDKSPTIAHSCVYFSSSFYKQLWFIPIQLRMFALDFSYSLCSFIYIQDDAEKMYWDYTVIIVTVTIKPWIFLMKRKRQCWQMQHWINTEELFELNVTFLGIR